MKTKHDKQQNHKWKLVGPQDSALWLPADPVQSGDDLRFVSGMEKIFRHDLSAVGLAATQIGVRKRVILVCPWAGRGIRRQQIAITVAANPEIVWHGEDKEKEPEGCLSFPGFSRVIERWLEIDVRFQLVQYGHELTEPSVARYSRWEARVWQHEIDHVNGICLVGEEWRKHGNKRQG